MQEDQKATLRKLLQARELFDNSWYAHQTGVRLPRAEAIEDFLSRGLVSDIVPLRWFDKKFYAELYPDVHAAGANPYLHFVLDGRRRGQYPNRPSFERDVRKVVASTVFDAELYRAAAQLSPASSRDTLARHYLSLGHFRYLPPHRNYDPGFIENLYEDFWKTTPNSFVYMTQVLSRPWFYPTASSAARDVAAVAHQIDEEYYLEQLDTEERPGTDPVLHHLAVGFRRGLDPNRFFSTVFYQIKHPDIRAAQMNPLLHYILAGEKEGRAQSLDFIEPYEPGERDYIPELPTILIVCHDASRTGAPIVGLCLARELSADHNVIVWVGKGGAMLSDFARTAVCLVSGFAGTAEIRLTLQRLQRMYPFHSAILNSVESYPVAASLRDINIPIVSLIHEFASYSLPKGKVARLIALSSLAAVPANIVKSAADEEFEGFLIHPPANLIVRPQGRCVPSLQSDSGKESRAASLVPESLLHLAGKPIIMGAGTVHIRKGVDLFLEVARQVVRDFPSANFVWVGGGYTPQSDPHYSIWLAEFIKRAGLENNAYFIEEQEDLKPFWRVCDVFLLSSRLDPFPNVALDALAHRVPIVCFEGSTGIADLARLKGSEIHLAPYCDSHAAAGLVKTLLKRGAPLTCDMPVEILKVLDFKAYVGDVRNWVEKASEKDKQLHEQAARVLSEQLFHPQFFLDGLPHWLERERVPLDWDQRAAEIYLELTGSGIFVSKPRPGFNDAVFNASRNSTNKSILDARAEEADTTHRVLFLENDHPFTTTKTFRGRSLIHIHLYYPELANYFASRLHECGPCGDIVVTTDTEEKAQAIRSSADIFQSESIRIEIAENRGRNFGPLMQVMEQGQHYDLVCHLHGKKSPELGKQSSDRWLDFLVGHLLGAPQTISSIHAAFEEEPTLGLLFPEDSSIVGWTKNLPQAQVLRELLCLKVPLPDHPEFPLGSMFWARPNALRPIWDGRLPRSRLPEEPIAYDGTALHALERLLPTIAYDQGYEWATICRPGLGRKSDW